MVEDFTEYAYSSASYFEVGIMRDGAIDIGFSDSQSPPGSDSEGR